MKYKTLAALGAATLALSGCATVIKGTSQSIVITTPPVSGAYCILSSAEGNWPVTTPNVVTVDKSKEDILVKCNKPGYQEASANIPSDFQGWTLGNLVLGGLIGVGVDAATGAMNEYPRAFAIPMTALTGPAPNTTSAAMVLGVSGNPRDLGITGSTVTPYSSISVSMTDPHGAFITTVKSDGPAFRAGLQTGDVVETFNGLRVDTYDDLTKIVSTTANGAVVQLGVLRKGHHLDVAVQL
ncbi:MAG TPA: PDZ domain-containing protein [Rhizomicrobium sp.]|jgi:hypothetical protein|nr:PDZ domain-containing protein [Rhizomicrobium sp.]